jgi:diaminopimelate epimerase
MSFETSGRVAKVQLTTPPADQTQVSVEMGEPDFRISSLPMKYHRSRCINGRIKVGRTSVRAICLSVGNPHAVVPVDRFDFDWRGLGEAIEKASIFPRGVNVEFVRVRNRKRIDVMEWERGVGETGSSGTGAAAAVAAMAVLGRVGRSCTVHFPAGNLQAKWRAEDNIIVLSGPVSYVMKGIYRTR